MSKFVCNALSGQMLNDLSKFQLDGIEITEDFFRDMTQDAISFMGHQDIAEKFGLEYNRENLFLKGGDVLYIAQYVGGRTKEADSQIDIKDKPLKFYQIYIEEK